MVHPHRVLVMVLDDVLFKFERLHTSCVEILREKDSGERQRHFS
jgi:hypothetical protein